jgi:2,4-dienoyl-CoA reductase-like NADH-dependent reductase (Old Yellow Enzyme family)
LLLDVLAAMREVVGPDYPVSVKVNSSDFQTGGFSLSDMNILAGWLDDAGLDLLEISGGNYEHAAILFGPDGQPTSETSRVREAYFMEFAADIRKQMRTTPLMVTGGIRSRATMEEALAKVRKMPSWPRSWANSNWYCSLL